MKSVGIDLVEIKEFEKSLKRTADMLERIFVSSELERHSSIENLAGWFAAKEAVMKAVWSLKDVRVDWHDVIISHGSRGQPFARLSDSLIERLGGNGPSILSVSISHTSSFATAFAFISFE